MSEQKYPRIGTAVWIIRNGKVLLGRREKLGFGVGTWCPPGGAVEYGETLQAAAIRETEEETGLILEAVRLISVVDDIFDHHWVTPYFVADWVSGEARDAIGEIGQWAWFEWNELPDPLYGPTRNFVKNGYNPLNFK